MSGITTAPVLFIDSQKLHPFFVLQCLRNCFSIRKCFDPQDLRQIKHPASHGSAWGDLLKVSLIEFLYKEIPSSIHTMTIYQINVPNYCFISTLTAAMPIACSVFPLCQLKHRQFPEDPACQILHWWTSTTAAVLGPAALQQSLSHNRFIAAVT